MKGCGFIEDVEDETFIQIHHLHDNIGVEMDVVFEPEFGAIGALDHRVDSSTDSSMQALAAPSTVAALDAEELEAATLEPYRSTPRAKK